MSKIFRTIDTICDLIFRVIIIAAILIIGAYLNYSYEKQLIRDAIEEIKHK